MGHRCILEGVHLAGPHKRLYQELTAVESGCVCSIFSIKIGRTIEKLKKCSLLCERPQKKL